MTPMSVMRASVESGIAEDSMVSNKLRNVPSVRSQRKVEQSKLEVVQRPPS